jgi:hypothetical protein
MRSRTFREFDNMEREFLGELPLSSGPLLIPLEAGEKFHTGRLTDRRTLDGIAKIIEEANAEKAALHPEP